MTRRLLRSIHFPTVRTVRSTGFTAALCAGIAMTIAACGGSGSEGPVVRVTIPVGASFRTATDSLVSAGIVGQPALFRLYARFQGRDRVIHPGTYLLEQGLAWNSILARLRDGSSAINRVTIPEGFTIAQIGPLLFQQAGILTDSLQVAVRDSALRAQLGVPAETVEGYLFPDTYFFPPGTTARQAVAEMVKRFEREWTPEHDAALRTRNMTRHQLMTMASIVEKEAVIPDERPVIAGVYYNRLRIGMPLQADPTVQYALGNHVERVMLEHLKTESPYNTYQHPGLPPGPIASPGGPSIRAALHPADVPYLYFVAAPDGHHEFRTTYEKHTEAIRAIRGSGTTRASSGTTSKSSPSRNSRETPTKPR